MVTGSTDWQIRLLGAHSATSGDEQSLSVLLALHLPLRQSLMASTLLRGGRSLGSASGEASKLTHEDLVRSGRNGVGLADEVDLLLSLGETSDVKGSAQVLSRVLGLLE